MAWYPSHMCLQKLHLHHGLSETLLKATPIFCKAFIKKYSGIQLPLHVHVYLCWHINYTCIEHRCESPGCGSVLVLDGNMKNNREVCFATMAGYAEFSGLVGKIRTGCPNTPSYKSRYCSLHSPITVIPQEAQFSNDGDELVAHLNQERQSEEQHAAIITGKRTTRTSTFYQVMWLYTFMHSFYYLQHYRWCGLENQLLKAHGSLYLHFLPN